MGSGNGNTVEDMAGRLYRVASMLVGDGLPAVQLIEAVLARPDARPGMSEVDRSVVMAEEAVRAIDGAAPGSLDVPGELEHVLSCIDDKDLDAAGITRPELEQILQDAPAARFRAWLEELKPSMRVIFVLRAATELPTAQVAAILGRGWAEDSVREYYRQALCSLTREWIQATVTP